MDNASTTHVRREAIDAMVVAMAENYANPSSGHAMGRRARAALEDARTSVARGLGCPPEELFFTSGGTESDNWAILGAAEACARHGRHMITTLAEHDAVGKPAALLKSRGWDVTYLRPDKSGRVDPADFAAALRGDTSLASVMLVNNETGARNPVEDMTREIRRRGLPVVFHTDAVQGYMKTDFTAAGLGADLITISAHKLHGPKGVGALYIRRGLRLGPLIHGGGQEREKRSGTEALPAAVGFGAAAQLALLERESSRAAVAALYELTVSRLREALPEAVVISPGDTPHILSLSLPGYKSAVLMNCLEADGIFVSNSSACTRGGRSHVLDAMRLPDDVIDGALRVSFSPFSTADEASFFVERLAAAAHRLRRGMRRGGRRPEKSPSAPD